MTRIKWGIKCSALLKENIVPPIRCITHSLTLSKPTDIRCVISDGDVVVNTNYVVTSFANNYSLNQTNYHHHHRCRHRCDCMTGLVCNKVNGLEPFEPFF